MAQHAAEEKKIAEEKKHFLNGKPYITVIGDAGWAKRSYGHGMNSNSGVVSNVKHVYLHNATLKRLYMLIIKPFSNLAASNCLH